MHTKLKSGWSPWQIEGRLKAERNNTDIISHESIYRYIYGDSERRYLLCKHLRRKHRSRLKKNRRNSRITKELRIATRPEYINNREEFGHWECELMVFKRGVKTNLITIRERKSRFMLAIKKADRCANTTAMNIITTLKKLKSHVKSITFDQGFEFSKYQWIKDCICTDIYFCDPASPYQKGAIENGNAAIRLEFQRDYELIRSNKNK